jgi:hypothetical protein
MIGTVKRWLNFEGIMEVMYSNSVGAQAQDVKAEKSVIGKGTEGHKCVHDAISRVPPIQEVKMP